VAATASDKGAAMDTSDERANDTACPDLNPERKPHRASWVMLCGLGSIGLELLNGLATPLLLAPYRGAVATGRGSLDLPCVAFIVVALLGVVPGILAWVMGSRDLRQMGQGLMDGRGRAATISARDCGAVGAMTGLVVVGLLLLGLLPYLLERLLLGFG